MLRIFLIMMAVLLPAAAQAEDRWMSIPNVPSMPEAEEAGHVQVNGIEMYFASYGPPSGTPILLIHGGLAHGDIWASQVADLMQTHRVIVADTRGHGRSTNDGSAYSYDLLADDYLSLLDELGVQQVHLVGWSDGANIGFNIALTDPDRLASLVAHAGNVQLDGIDPSVESNAVFGAYVGKMAGDYAGISPTPDGFNEFLGGVAAMWGTEKAGGLSSLNKIDVPTLILHSEYDEAILANHSQDIAKAIPSATYVMLPKVSHFSMFQAPDEYTAAIRGMVR